MTTRTETYNLSQATQMVDINSDIENFIARFEVKSRDGHDFKCMVIEETPKTDELEFNTSVKGEIEGEIKAEYNNYKNYYLLLKSDEPCEVDVRIYIQKLDKKTLPSHETQTIVKQDSSSKKNMFVIIGIMAIFLIAGGYIYSTYGKKKVQTTKASSSSSSYGRTPSRGEGSTASSPYLRIPETLRHRIYRAN